MAPRLITATTVVILFLLAGCERSERRDDPPPPAAKPAQSETVEKTEKKAEKPVKKAAPERVETMNAGDAPYIAGRDSKIYHERHCRYASAVQSPLGYRTAEDAERTGHIPCEFCTPRIPKGQNTK